MADIMKAINFYELIRQNERVTVRRAEEETGYCARTIRRKIEALSSTMPVRIEGGVIVKDRENG